MLTASLLLNLVLAVLLVLAGGQVAREYRKRKQRNLLSRWPLPRVPLEQFDERFVRGDLGPSREAEARLILGGNRGLKGGTSDYEAWILAVLAKSARVMFEFGTCTGRTTYLWALNSPADARIYTITLSPQDTVDYQAEAGDDDSAASDALSESAFDSFYYSGTPVARKVHQLFGDSKEFDETSLVGQCDLVFVDGSHAYSYVASDSEKALRMVRKGGLVLWHDYRGPRSTPDVFRALNELGKRLPLVHVEGTSLVAYRND